MTKKNTNKIKVNRKKWYRAIVVVVFLFLTLFAIWFINRKEVDEKNSVDRESVETTITSDPPTTTKPAEIKNTEAPIVDTKEPTLPEKFQISVPFTSQAPFGVWDALHEDACEEASLLMLKHWRAKTKINNTQAIDDEIKALVAFEEQSGYGTSIALQQLAEIAQKQFNLKGTVKTASIDKIKNEIAAGRPVIVGAAGKVLPNPNFRNGGPNYHMLVVTGYTPTHFVTNDPGTRKGENFTYTYNDLFNAIHNWNLNNILDGTKEYLIF